MHIIPLAWIIDGGPGVIRSIIGGMITAFTEGAFFSHHITKELQKL